jgi:hypothetical protein
MPDKYDKWLPKFLGNNVITAEEHIAYFYSKVGDHKIPRDHEDVVMKLFEMSLDEEAKSWYRNLQMTVLKHGKPSMMPS